MKKLIALQPFLEACGVKLDDLTFEDGITVLLRLEKQLSLVLDEINDKKEDQSNYFHPGHPGCR